MFVLGYLETLHYVSTYKDFVIYFYFDNIGNKIFNRERYSRSMSSDNDNDNESEHRTHGSAVSPSLSPGMRAARRNDRSSGGGIPPIVSGNRDNHRNGYNARDEESAGDDSSASLSYAQLDAYNVDPKSLYELHETQKECLSRVVRTQIFSRVKFLPKSGKEHEKLFGSFWRPDLLRNTPKYIDVILDNFADLKNRKEDEDQIVSSVYFWMKASYVVRQVILDRRSNVTQRMKRELVIGMFISVRLCIVIFL